MASRRKFERAPGAPDELSAPCRIACPVDKDIPGFLRAIARGDPVDAWRIAYRDQLFPGVLGWICPHPCESACRLASAGSPVPVCDLKRWLTTEHAPPPDLQPPRREAGPAVAIIGAGPAGLAAAHDLAVAGARVTLFDRQDHPGGLLTGCIPDFRLPPAVAEQDIERILSLGIRFRPGFALESERQLEALRENGFAAVLLAVGAGDDRLPEIPGWRATDATRTAIAFLRDAGRGLARLDGARVVVIGGGNGAIDAARAALRVGAREVRVLYRRGRDKLRAFPSEIEGAESEGISIHPWTVVEEIVWEGDRLAGIRCVRTDPENLTGGPRPERELQSCDAVVFAIGQVPTLTLSGGSIPGLVTRTIAPGESGTVVEAIASGRRAARRVEEALRNDGRWRPGNPARSDDQSRIVVAGSNGNGRRNGNAVMSPIVAAREAGRCLGCDRGLALDPERCIVCGTCSVRCAHDALAWLPGTNGTAHLMVSEERCQRCGDCIAACPSGALKWQPWTRPNRICGLRPARSTQIDGTSSSPSAGQA